MAWLKNNKIASLISLFLAVALIIVGSLYAKSSSEIATLNSSVQSKDSIIASLEKQKSSLQGYEEAVKEFYIYGAVIAVEGDNKYYHRYNCPDTNMSEGGFSFLVFNENQAVNAGYKKCPTCFGYSDDEYCEKYIEN